MLLRVAGDVLTACYDGSNKTLTMDCGSEALVRVLKAFYGYSAHGTCHYTEGDCTRLQQQSLECVGRSTCTVPLEGAQQGGVMLPACQKRSNYFQVEYQCVPGKVHSVTLVTCHHLHVVFILFSHKATIHYID